MRLIKFILLNLLLVISAPSLSAETGMPAIEQSAQENKHLFIFFYKDQNDRMLHAQQVFDQTLQKIGNQAHAVKIAISDPSEKSIIDKFDLRRSPMPFVLVLAPNGAVTGGFHSSFTEQQLMGSFVSSGMAKCLKGLQDKKLVFVCLQNDQTINHEAALKGVKDFKADARFGNAVEVVIIDPSDKQEQKFLSQLAADKHDSQAITIFMAPPAETIGQYKGATHKERLIADLQKASSGCCGPGGCGAGGCCPGGKCK